MDTVADFWRWSTTTTITIRSRLSKAFSGTLTSASCASEATITRDSIDARRTKGNIAYLRGSKTIKDHQCFIQVRTLDDDDDMQLPVHVFFDIKPNKSIANTCPTSWSVSAPTRTSSIGGTVTRAFKSFCYNWKTGVKVVNNR